MTERRNFDTYGLRRFKDREWLLKLMGFTVDYRGNQGVILRSRSFSLLMRDRRTSATP